MANVALTNGRVRDFVCPPEKKVAFLWGDKPEGFGVRASKRSKDFIFQGKLNGKTIRMTIGSTKTWSLDEAKEQARQYRQQIDQGRDPRIVKEETTAADEAKRERDRLFSAPAIDVWWKYVEARRDQWGSRHIDSHHLFAAEGGKPITKGRKPNGPAVTQPGILYEMLNLSLSEISRDVVAQWIKHNRPIRPTVTRTALTMLATFLTWCSDQPDYKEQVNLDACVRMKRELPKPAVKSDCLQREQLTLWFESVRRIPSIVQRNYLQCLLLTGARRNELAELRWEDVDFTWKTLVIRDKVEGTRTIPLTPYMQKLLLELKAFNNTPPAVYNLRRMERKGKPWKPSEWVFFSRMSVGDHITDPRAAHEKALQAVGLPLITLHGLRRSFKTMSEWVECPAGITAQIMGHKPSAIAEKHYTVRAIDMLRAWHIKIEGWMLTEAGIEQPEYAKTALSVVPGTGT